MTGQFGAQDLPQLTMDDFTLRAPQLADLEPLHNLTLADAMREFLGMQEPRLATTHERLLRTIGGWHLYGYGAFMVVHRPTGNLIANCGIFHSYRGLGDDFDDMPEAGWIIAQKWQRQGLARALMARIFQWFDSTQTPRRTVCMIEQGHDRSDNVALSLGFKHYRTTELSPDAERPMRLYERYRG
ncbi:MAG: GNAT family N-acetyltransferase [Sphingopyxis sp.]